MYHTTILVLVMLKETVGVDNSSVAEVHLALVAIPCCIAAPLWLLLIPAVPAATSDCGVVGLVLDGKVTEGKVCGWRKMSVVTLLRVVFPHKSLCELEP